MEGKVMGYVEVKQVKEYLIHVRGEEELDLFIQTLVNCNPTNKEMIEYRDNLVLSLRKRSGKLVDSKRPLDKQGLPDLRKEPK